MLGDIVELSVVVRDLEAAAERYARLFGLKVHHRGESKEFGFKNAILPTGIGHIELLQPTDPDKRPVAGDVGESGVDDQRPNVAWVHPQEANGLLVELRHRESYD